LSQISGFNHYDSWSVRNRRLRILFVEGDVLARNIIRTFLQESYDVLVAANGGEALEVSRNYEGPIDILLSDAEMAGLAGLPLHYVVKAERPGIVILLMTADSRKSTRDGQVRGFLSKPFQLGALYAALKGVLEERHSNKQEFEGRVGY
jgi:two-component system, cell cycle sensor histidine kinase and response regulator CckA